MAVPAAGFLLHILLFFRVNKLFENGIENPFLVLERAVSP